MAKNTQPIAKRCKALGISPAIMGYAKKTTTRNANTNVRKKQSEYALQMKEKQKVKFVYGVLEKQFFNYFTEAARRKGQTGENLLIMLESRLDNVVFRLGYASTRREARQLVSHAHFSVNGKKVNIPSYQVKADDVVAVRNTDCGKIKECIEKNSARPVPVWMTKNADGFSAVIARSPERSDVDFDVEEHLIVELYSK